MAGDFSGNVGGDMGVFGKVHDGDFGIGQIHGAIWIGQLVNGCT